MLKRLSLALLLVPAVLAPALAGDRTALAVADITGDGREEAALEGMAIIPDGNSYVTYVYLFTLAEGASEPELLATVVGGDRADGSIRLTGLDAAGLHLARAILGPDDAMCCPSGEQHEVWTWNGSELVEDESARRIEPTEQ